MPEASVQAIVRYQEVIRREKEALLKIDGSRVVLAAHVGNILEGGLFRSIRRETLREILAALQNPAASAEAAALSRLLELPFYEEVWNKARQAARERSATERGEAVAAWEEAFREGARLRNVFLEEYAYLIPKMLRYYFNAAGPSAVDDLESEGVLGLFRALESFDVGKQGDLRVHIQTRILSSMMDYHKETEYAKARLAQKNAGGKPEEPAEEPKPARSLVRNLSEAAAAGAGEEGGFLVSLDDLVPHAEDSHYSDLIVGDKGNPFEIAEGQELVRRLQSVLERCDPLARFMIQAKWNLDEEGVARAGLSTPAEAAEKLRAEAVRRLLDGLQASPGENRGA